ncbi:DUF1572 domain-containing protein [Mucilaginibacter rubeus]|uniref:DUF1572 domain-containing protein n=1 Tax=Mucilaginibacter rubeus TaxID=2027860 RepID=A0AAE6JB58_9SPHI|nr:MULTISPECIES: DUF1572 family protein [Mucilaginibacter]QEM02138.1 DUF1572 domain-containing protein [Mucilaginibacter rubeus]QEM14766.1 DUF1572 domain-containing protein [Mucilaginibacter gossypii]QTE42527.1 DUF1572 domain-containing protein [Mucilaginibacter rubeus]QTE49130.1 DUF1572 domain-containing protein [Mucilaginibacter rubeus]QTE54228.1 DUF1572 domain-containing protein [Mucilaginibacter rubeus]
MENDYLTSVKKQFAYYKSLGEKTFEQLTDEQLYWQYNPESNSIAMIVKHMSGNMISRWTDIFTTDGEKPTRNREAEFTPSTPTRQTITETWEQGWQCLFDTLDKLTADDLGKIVYIRNQGHTAMEAINRQLAHYPYHVGQIVFLGKMLCNENWHSLSIPRGQSENYNADKFAQEKRKVHFTDEK